MRTREQYLDADTSRHPERLVIVSCNMPCAFSDHLYAKHKSCQFSGLPLFDFDDKQWCAFHLPIESANGEDSPKAGWSNEEQQKYFHEPLAQLMQQALASGEALDLKFAIFGFDALFQAPREPPSEKLLSIALDGARFEKKVFFQRIHFGHSTSFHGTFFADRADFRQSVFHGGAYFWHAKFNGIAQFMGVPFEDGLHLKSASFAKSADFSAAIFSGEINLDRTTFEDKADFSAATAKEQSATIANLRARGATFRGETTFQNRTFGGLTDFRSATFFAAPDFHGCSLHQATFFSLESFLSVESEDAGARYRTLAQAMSDIRAHDEEGWFFALQQRALRRERHRLDPIRMFSAFYDMSSAYGQSLRRPILCLFVTLIVFSLTYGGLAYFHGSSLEKSIHAALVFAAQQVFRPLYVWADVASSKWPAAALGAPKSLLPVILATAQTLLTVTWIYLIALGIRWRFRRW